MIKPNEAKRLAGEYRKTDGTNPKQYFEDIFSEDEYEKAEAIVDNLKGMTIASAVQLLDKVKEYMLCTVVK